MGPARADRNARGDHILWLHPGRPPATGPGLAAAVQALQELQARSHPQTPTFEQVGSCFEGPMHFLRSEMTLQTSCTVPEVLGRVLLSGLNQDPQGCRMTWARRWRCGSARPSTSSRSTRAAERSMCATATPSPTMAARSSSAGCAPEQGWDLGRLWKEMVVYRWEEVQPLLQAWWVFFWQRETCCMHAQQTPSVILLLLAHAAGPYQCDDEGTIFGVNVT